ncbi:MAG: three-Cys-motif partner protein TcmP [Gammaproteobacteria bacterium]|nr:three-Cys-motif partner protein TcmP [Gammaproteobacteria bacterium]
MNQVKEKVQVYSEYLSTYLAILNLPSNKFEEIHIYEPLAGEGEDKIEGKDKIFDGSVKQAFPIIEGNNKNRPDKPNRIKYFINDKNTKKHNKLKESFLTPDSQEWLRIYNTDAQTFINERLQDIKGKNIHSLWFVDPCGYTQVKKEDYKKIFNDLGQKAELLIFVPLIYIIRFLAALDNKKVSGVADFLKDWDINRDELPANHKPQDFEKLLVSKMKKLFPNKYIKSYSLALNDRPQDFFSLIFISSNIFGADKFLEAGERIFKKTRHGLSFGGERYNEKDALSKLKGFIEERPRNNVELYEWGIDNDFYPVKMKELLDTLYRQGDLARFSYHDRNKRASHNYINHDLYAQSKIGDESAFKTLFTIGSLF